MEKLRPALDAVLRRCLAQSEPTGELTLDQLGDAIDTLAVSTDEIDALIGALEVAGRVISAPPGGGLERALGQVVRASAALRNELARRPTLQEVASRAQLPARDVRQALALLRIMQR